MAQTQAEAQEIIDKAHQRKVDARVADPKERSLVFLVMHGVPYAEAKSMSDDEREAWCTIAAEFKDGVVLLQPGDEKL